MRFKKLAALAAIGALTVALAACDVEGSGPDRTWDQATTNNSHTYDGGTFDGTGSFGVGVPAGEVGCQGSGFVYDCVDDWAIALGSQVQGSYRLTLGIPTSDQGTLNVVMTNRQTQASVVTGSGGSNFLGCDAHTCYYQTDPLAFSPSGQVEVVFRNLRAPSYRGTDGYVFEIKAA